MNKENAKPMVDIEFVSTEWQGAKMVYIIEIRTQKQVYRVTRRYNQMEETCKRITSKYKFIDVPKICGKELINEKTETIE